MSDYSQIEAAYKVFADSLNIHLPDGLVDIDIAVLQELGLLQNAAEALPLGANHQFNMLESPEKITLFNDAFVIWIIPQTQSLRTHTLVLIALNLGDAPKLEVVLCFRGVYNTSKLLLRTLNAYLEEIRENESTLSKLH